jgi:L-proline amide hydrolase
MNKKLMAAIGMLGMLSVSISAGPSTKKANVTAKTSKNLAPSSKGKKNVGKENTTSVTPNHHNTENRTSAIPENSNQENTNFVPSAGAANAGVFDFEKIYDYKIDHGPNKDKVAPIYGLRFRLIQDNAQRLKKMLALSKEEFEKFRVLPEKERHKKMSDLYAKLYQKMDMDPELVDAIYDQITNDAYFLSNSKHFFDPECYERASEDGFLSGFYIPGEDSNKDPLILVHGGPNGSAVSMLSIGAELSKTTGRSVVLYTQRGCQGSGVSFDQGKDSFKQSAQDLGRVIDATLALTGKKQVVVFAHSFGPALVNEYLGTMDTGKVSSYIAAGPAETDLASSLRLMLRRKESKSKNRSKIEKEKNPLIKKSLMESARITGFHNLKKAKEYFERTINSDALGLMVNKAGIYEYSKNVSCDNNWAIDRDLFKRHRDKKAVNVLQNIKVPTLIIAGEHDSLDPKSAKITADKIPNSELRVMKKAAHWMYVEKSEEFYTLVKNFLDRVDAGEKIGTGKIAHACEKTETTKIKDQESVSKKRRIPVLPSASEAA